MAYGHLCITNAFLTPECLWNRYLCNTCLEHKSKVEIKDYGAGEKS